MKLTGWKIYLWLGWTGVAVGSCFLVMTIGVAAYETFFLTHSSKTQGTVIANVEKDTAADPQTGSSSQTDYCPQFRYQSADGATHAAIGSMCSNPSSFTIGEEVRVNYANWNHDHAEIDSFGDEWMSVLISGFAAAALMPIGFFLLRRVHLDGHSLDPIGFWDPN